MPPVSPSALERYRLFEFDVRTYEIVAGFFDEMQDAGGPLVEPSRRELLEELVCLTAAEFALEREIAEPSSLGVTRAPIRVGVSRVWLSLAKADCIMMGGCPHGPFGLADVTAFSGDVAKLLVVGPPEVEPTRVIGEVVRAVGDLEREHRDSPSRFARALAASGTLRLQGVLWAVKLALPQLDVTTALEDAVRAFELKLPAGADPAPA